MAEVGPGEQLACHRWLFSRRRLASGVEERQAGAGFLVGRPAAEGGHVQLDRAARGPTGPDRPSTRSAQSRAWPTTSGSFISVSACAGTFDTLRRPMVENGTGSVEGQEHRIEEVAPDVQVEASPAVAVERARIAPAGRGLP